MFFLFIYLALLTFNGVHFELRREEERERERERERQNVPLVALYHRHKSNF
jgi:hypothetical protein